MRKRLHLVLLLTLVASATAVRDCRAEQPVADDDARVEFFEKKIRPLLAGHCYNCHSADTNSQGGLRVDDRNGLLNGGGKGPAVVPGRPEKSLLLKAVGYQDDDLKMPPKEQLSAAQVADLTRWIRDGAAWPKVVVPVLNQPDAKYERLRKEHWAWQPIHDAPVPTTAGDARTDVDRFLAVKLREKGLKQVGPADKTTLIRRATFDLTGLPPAPEEVEAFVNDSSTSAFETLVDRLLASPAFGERWGRHWLDVARYAESTGSSRNLPYPHAWRYRDYVIDAFNADKPFDQFVREQVAGDLLPAASPSERDQHVIATGYLAIGVKDVNQRFKVRYVMDNIDEQIDAIGRGLLGLTVSCARCHNHKFDPIPTTDYYALAGIFHSTDLCAGLRNKMGGGGLDYYDTSMLVNIGPEAKPNPAQAEKIDATKKEFAAAKAEFEALRGKPEGAEPGPDGRPKRAIAREKMNKKQAELLALTDPAVIGAVAIGVRDSKVVGDTELRVRGEAEKLGPVVARGYLSVVEVPGAPKINPAQSGRLELAQWLTSDRNPLTARVIVNRVWQHLFGQGLVTTVDNFGVTGDRPVHPELLDHLATQFIRDGWSIKRLVRSLVLTDAYRLSSEAPAANVNVDPTNRLLWRHSPRRLDAEEIRDAALFTAGDLDRSRPAASPAKDLKVVEMNDDGAEAKRIIAETQKSKHRSVYLPLLRGVTPRSLGVFDFADQGTVTGSRDSTTVAPQALYMLNDPFVRREATTLAERVLKRTDEVSATRLRRLYLLTLGRTPEAAEIEKAEIYLADYESSSRQTAATPDATANAWVSLCQALLASAEFRYVR